MDILRAIDDPALFRPWFPDRSSWAAWRAVLAAAFALPLTDEQLEVFKRLTGRSEAPQSAAKELWVVAGRRSGKTLVGALLAVYLAVFRNHAPHLQKGEMATILIIAVDRKQARLALRGYPGQPELRAGGAKEQVTSRLELLLVPARLLG